MTKRSVYEHPAQFKLKMTLVAAVLLNVAIALESRILIFAVGLALIWYVFYRVLTDRVEPRGK